MKPTHCTVFFVLLCRYVESEDEEGRPVEEVLLTEPKHKFIIPLCCLKTFQPGPISHLWIKRCILQYTIVKPFCTLLACILNAINDKYYNDGSFSPTSAYLYIVVIINISVSVSLYCLVLFYQVSKSFLKPYSPLLKFLSIKAVVFFSFWQSTLIAILNELKLIPSIGSWDVEQVATGINNLLICVEMFFLCIANYFIFPYKTYKPVVKREREPAMKVFKKAVRHFATDVVNQQDVVDDVKHAFSPTAHEKAKKKYKDFKEHSELLDSDERQIPLESGESSK